MTTNLKIINDLKNFIAESNSCGELREVFITSKADFSRERKLGFERLVLLLINFFRKSYSVEIADFYNWIDLESLTVSKSAFCQQRMKIKSVFFACLNEILVQSFYHHHKNSIKSWSGMRIIAIDGSNVCLGQQPEIISYFGTQDNQSKKKAPMAQVLSAYDVLNGITIKADIYPIKTSEQKLAQQ